MNVLPGSRAMKLAGACSTSGRSAISAFRPAQCHPACTTAHPGFMPSATAPGPSPRTFCGSPSAAGQLTARRRGASTVTAAYKQDSPEVLDRVIGSLPFLLPLLDALPYGKFIFFEYPFIARFLAPLAPLNSLYNAFPFAPFLVFLGVYSIVNNYSLSRFVRYNAMQAVLLDILLIIPSVILNDLVKQPHDAIGLAAYTAAFNTIFLFISISTVYGIGSCAVGQTARLPLVASAADSQVQDGPGF